MTTSFLGLRTRALAVLALLLASLSSLAWWVAARADTALREVDRARFEAQTTQLADTLSYAVLARSAALLDEPLAAFSRSPDLVAVRVVDDAGALLLEKSGARRAERDDVSVTARVRTRARAPGAAADDPFAAELEAAPRDVGALTATFSSEATARVQRDTRRAVLGAVGAVGLVALVAVGLLLSSVVRRIRALQLAAARVRGGDLSAQVSDDGVDELSSLARDFNSMTSSIEAQNKTLAERESLAALGRATAVIAHELKNPLGIVLGAAQIASNEARPEEARREAAAIVLDETRRLSRTLDDLLSYAKPRAPVSRAVDVEALARSVASRIGLEGGPAHGIAVEVTGAARVARADPEQLERALWNLVQNAAQAGAARVVVSLSDDDAHVHVAVRDDGSGVPEPVRAQLFVPFSTSKQRGTGLGLASARRALREVGGELEYQGVGLDQKGACFSMRLLRAQTPGQIPGQEQGQTQEHP